MIDVPQSNRFVHGWWQKKLSKHIAGQLLESTTSSYKHGPLHNRLLHYFSQKAAATITRRQYPTVIQKMNSRFNNTLDSDQDTSRTSPVWPRKDRLGFSESQKSLGTGTLLSRCPDFRLCVVGFPPFVLPSLSTLVLPSLSPPLVLPSCRPFTLPSLSALVLPWCWSPGIEFPLSKPPQVSAPEYMHWANKNRDHILVSRCAIRSPSQGYHSVHNQHIHKNAY